MLSTPETSGSRISHSCYAFDGLARYANGQSLWQQALCHCCDACIGLCTMIAKEREQPGGCCCVCLCNRVHPAVLAILATLLLYEGGCIHDAVTANLV